MKKLFLGMAVTLSLVLALALGAWADEMQGKIQNVDPAERAIVLDDGTQVWVAEGVSMDNVKEGASVKVTYEERDGKKVATSLEVSE